MKQVEVNIQSDWGKKNTDDYIKNKPAIPKVVI